MRQSVYHVERLCWQRSVTQWHVLPGSDRVSTYLDRAEAEATCREAEWKIRRRMNPFLIGGPFLQYQTASDAARLFDWCLDAGVEPTSLDGNSATWAAWWRISQASFTDLQRAKLWEALDRLRFFRVVEGTSGLSCHLVSVPQETDWDYIDPTQDWGSTPYMLVRQEAMAEELCHELYGNELARIGGYFGNQFGRNSWKRPDRDPFAALDPDSRVEYRGVAEHGPIELHSRGPLHIGQNVYVVLRRHWYLDSADESAWRWVAGRRSSGRAVAAFDTLEAADALMATLEERDRPVANLFRFGPPHEWSHLHPSDLWGMLSDLAPIDFTSLWRNYRATDQLWIHWWDKVVPELSEADISLVWSLYDRLRFYEVVAVEYRE